jgi:hypothetical protein
VRTLEDLLRGAGLVSDDVLARARLAAEERGGSVAQVLVEDHDVPADTLAELVAREMGSIVVDVDLGAFDREAVRSVPEEAARRFLMVPIARGPAEQVIRVAFANPLDAEALRHAAEATGLEIDPLVATVHGILAVLDREYAARNTEIIRAPRGPRSDIPAEVTRRIASNEGPAAGPGTSPLHRLETDATSEQRHEALLLTLIEAGVVTRAEYVTALKRLLGR